jgi:hypothetical protein
MRQRLKTMIANQKHALKASPPKSRDRVRRRLRALEVAQQIRREIRA